MKEERERDKEENELRESARFKIVQLNNSEAF